MNKIVRLGSFILGSLIAFGVAIFMIGDKQFLFSTTYQLQAPFDNVAGLANGAEVRVGGVHMGTVNEIRMPTQPGEKMVVIMDMENSTRKIIKKDSVASIETEGLLGNKFMQISFGSMGAESAQNGDTLQGQPPLDLSDLIKKANEIMDTTNLTLKNANAATSNMQAITEKINQGDGTVGALINDKKVYDQISAASSDMRATAAQAKVGVTAFQENMQALKKNWLIRGFFKNRGYEDSTELTKHEIAELPEGSPVQKFRYNAKDIFDKPDTAKLKNQKLFDRVGEYLEQNNFGLAVIIDHTGLGGDHDHNLTLTQARAMVVREYLAEKFRLDDTRIKTKGLGEEGSSGMNNQATLEVLVYSEDTAKPSNREDALSPKAH